jgi:hypothetical protein
MRPRLVGKTTQTYLVECYAPGIAREEVESAAARVLDASAAMRGEGCSVDYVGALLVPEDEVVFHVFASTSAHAVREASSRASVRFDRVVESVTVGSLNLRRDDA